MSMNRMDGWMRNGLIWSDLHWTKSNCSDSLFPSIIKIKDIKFIVFEDHKVYLPIAENGFSPLAVYKYLWISMNTYLPSMYTQIIHLDISWGNNKYKLGNSLIHSFNAKRFKIHRSHQYIAFALALALALSKFYLPSTTISRKFLCPLSSILASPFIYQQRV